MDRFSQSQRHSGTGLTVFVSALIVALLAPLSPAFAGGPACGWVFLGDPAESAQSWEITSARRLLGRLDDPYSIESALIHPTITPAPEALARRVIEHELIDFNRLVRGSLSDSLVVSKLVRWVRSPEHAFYFYDRIREFPESLRPAILQAMLQENPHFKAAITVSGDAPRLITLAMEKETYQNEILSYYRPSSIPEEVWLDLPPAQRQKVMRELFETGLTVGEHFTPSGPPEPIVPTSLKPVELGPLRPERLANHLWEVSHRRGTLTLEQLLESMRLLSRWLGESDAFHVHAVLEMARGEPLFKRFVYWIKQLNDYLFLLSLEAGDHYRPLAGFMPFQVIRETLPYATPEKVSTVGLKFYRVGLRGVIYGPAALSDAWVRIGVELRSITEDLRVWTRTLSQVLTSLRNERWKKLDAAQLPEGRLGLLIERNTREIEAELTSKLNLHRETISLLLYQVSLSSLPLEPLEKRTYLDYERGTLRKVSQAKAKTLYEARAAYRQRLREIDQKIREEVSKGKGLSARFKTEREREIWSAIYEWAQYAKPSGLFDGI